MPEETYTGDHQGTILRKQQEAIQPAADTVNKQEAIDVQAQDHYSETSNEKDREEKAQRAAAQQIIQAQLAPDKKIPISQFANPSPNVQQDQIILSSPTVRRRDKEFYNANTQPLVQQPIPDQGIQFSIADTRTSQNFQQKIRNVSGEFPAQDSISINEVSKRAVGNRANTQQIEDDNDKTPTREEVAALQEENNRLNNVARTPTQKLVTPG